MTPSKFVMVHSRDTSPEIINSYMLDKSNHKINLKKNYSQLLEKKVDMYELDNFEKIKELSSFKNNSILKTILSSR